MMVQCERERCELRHRWCGWRTVRVKELLFQTGATPLACNFSNRLFLDRPHILSVGFYIDHSKSPHKQMEITPLLCTALDVDRSWIVVQWRFLFGARNRPNSPWLTVVQPGHQLCVISQIKQSCGCRKFHFWSRFRWTRNHLKRL